MYITAQGCRLRNDLYCVEWDVKLYYTIPYRPMPLGRGFVAGQKILALPHYSQRTVFASPLSAVFHYN